MASDLDLLRNLKIAENKAFRRLTETPGSAEDWQEAFGAWLSAIRALQRIAAAKH